ncbi:hypothetical protein EDD15DRAFT_1733736 [Pisolithus albus]|nr:hypothetical protein EDD15DRAFT_1733736 [Pisolithus albus]
MLLCGMPLYSTNHESPQAPHKRDMFRERTSEHQSREISTRMTTMHNKGRSRFAEIVVGTVDDGQAAGLKKPSGHKPHPEAIVPSTLSDFVAQDRRKDSKLGSITGFLANEIQKCLVENRILTVTTSDLQRPVAYFWSPHDFVRGVIGALLGHKYLCEIGILHCDISENNVVLSLRRDGLGALIDFDMAIVRRPNMPTPLPEKSAKEVAAKLVASIYRPPAPLPASDEQYKAQRTGTTPYMSVGVLAGAPHTHFDDIESFLYVLVLFFVSYKGPLEKDTLKRAWLAGFTQPVGMGRLSHVTEWPDMFKEWTTGSFRQISNSKLANLHPASGARFIQCCLPHIRSRWEPVSQSTSIAVSELVSECWLMFSDLKVTHSEEANYKYPFE